MKLLYQFIAVFVNFSATSSHLHPLQVENCDSNSQIVVDEDDKLESGLKGLKPTIVALGAKRATICPVNLSFRIVSQYFKLFYWPMKSQIIEKELCVQTS